MGFILGHLPTVGSGMRFVVVAVASSIAAAAALTELELELARTTLNKPRLFLMYELRRGGLDDDNPIRHVPTLILMVSWVMSSLQMC